MPPDGFQWDEQKNKINIQKHGIAFEDAARIFRNPTLDRVDDRQDYGELRTNSLGDIDGHAVVNVTHTDRTGQIRIISARSANSAEREHYLEYRKSIVKDEPSHISSQSIQKPPVKSFEDMNPDYTHSRER